MSDLTKRNHAGIAVVERRPGVGAGLAAPFDGFAFLARTPAAWPLALVPVAVAVTLTALLGWVALDTVPGWVERAMGAGSGGWELLTKLTELFASLVALLVALLLGFGLAQPLSGPALERLVRRAEADAGGAPWPKTSVFADVARSVQCILLAYGIGLPILAALFVVGFLFPPATIVTVPLKIAVTAMMIAWDLFDYPLSIRGLPVGRRVAFIRHHFGAVFGFGIAIALLSMVTCGTLTLPVGVVGAARLLLAIERWETRSPEPGGRARMLGRG